MHLLKLRNLSVTFQQNNGSTIRAVRGVDMDISEKEVHSLVGESGSGKTVMTQSILGLLSSAAEISGSAVLSGTELLNLPADELRNVRGVQVGVVFQEPSRYLNPAFTIGNQITEMLRAHLHIDRHTAKSRAAELIDLVGLGDSTEILGSYSHELSGGMRQRAMIAMAVSCNPSLLIADEPTTALDVTVERKILELLLELKDRLGMSLLFISHNLALVHEISDRVSVMYLGKIAETGTRDQIFDLPYHPYTKLLLGAVPDPARRGKPLASIPGQVPDAAEAITGCGFHPRCPFADQRCRTSSPELRGLESADAPDHLASCHRIEELL